MKGENNMSATNKSASGIRIGITLVVICISLLSVTQVNAQQVGVGFTAAGTETSLELTNSYQDLAALTIAAPQNGFVVLTGSGYLTLTTAPSLVGTVWGQASISIGPISGASNNENETAVELPHAEGGGLSYRYPFSITTVVPVNRGTNRLYMVGIRDPNTASSTWYATSLKLTALFVNKRID